MQRAVAATSKHGLYLEERQRLLSGSVVEVSGRMAMMAVVVRKDSVETMTTMTTGATAESVPFSTVVASAFRKEVQWAEVRRGEDTISLIDDNSKNILQQQATRHVILW